MKWEKVRAKRHKKWTDALRSGLYEQVTGALVSEKDGVLKHCCLGVACDVMGLPLGEAYDYGSDTAVLPRIAQLWLDVEDSDPRIDWPDDMTDPDGFRYAGGGDTESCSGLNDGLELTYEQIADLVDYMGVK